MGDADGALPPSKKRVAGRQLTKDSPDEDGPELEMGSFQRASEEVLAMRRIVKARRHQLQSISSSSNPFASICLVPPTNSSEKTSANIEPQISGEREVIEEQDASKEKQDENGEDNGTETGALMNEPDKGGENSTKLEGNTDVLAAESGKLKDDAVEEVAQSAETAHNAENGRKEADQKAREDTHKEAGEGTEKEVGEETEKTLAVKSDKDTDGETEKIKPNNDCKNKTEPVASVSLFQQLSSNQNAFAGLTGTGFSGTSFSFGSISKEGSAFGASFGPRFGFKNENPFYPSLDKGSSNNGIPSFPLFETAATDRTKSGAGGIASMREVPVETGEENEKSVFTADAILFEYLDGGWKERGKGELKVNVATSGAEKARLVMRARGNYRLILNASLYPDISLKNMEKKGITFACMNSAGEGKAGLATYALKFKDSSIVKEFHEAVMTHKGKKTTGSKTPDNSPNASDD